MTENEKIDRIVDNLGCSINEAKDIIASDKAIDRNQATAFDLTKEQEKEALKLAHKGDKVRKPATYRFEKRERKPNETKQDIIAYLFNCLKDYPNAEVTNIERQIKFSFGENDYELTLVQKRKPKN